MLLQPFSQDRDVRIILVRLYLTFKLPKISNFLMPFFDLKSKSLN
jgi:hypothetical protein